MNILITSGGTRVPIDSVRYIGNMSTGRFGAELEYSFCDKSHNVTFFHEKGSKTSQYIWIKPDEQVNPLRVEYKNYDDYLNVIELAKNKKPDIIISAAAVSDYVVEKQEGKISSSSDELIITLKKAKKVLPEFKKVSPDSMVVGFKLLVSPTHQEILRAVKKVLDNGADCVVYNDLTEIRKGNSVRLVFDKELDFVEVKDAEELVTHIISEHGKFIKHKTDSNGL
jgi:phosphopantothenoylcysteine synthetase/decarboxylase